MTLWEIQSDTDCAFVRGNLISFRELEPYKVYSDENSVVYDLTDFFYTDLEAHVKNIVSARGDVYFDEQGMKRIENVCDYYRDRENIKKAIYYRSAES